MRSSAAPTSGLGTRTRQGDGGRVVAEVVTTVDGVSYSLGDIAHVSDLSWSTGWPFGCLEASWQMDLPVTSFPTAVMPNAMVEIWDGPVRVWSGYLKEPVPGEPWRVHAVGWYATFANLLALDASEIPTSVPDDAVFEAISRAGLPITVASSLASTPITSDSETVSMNPVSSLLDAYAAQEGKRWRVDADRRLWVEADPVDATYLLESTEVARGVADDDYATAMYARYVSSVDVDGNPDGYGVEPAVVSSPPAGRRERSLDLTDQGVLLAVDAEALASNHLDLNRARLGYISGVEVRFGELVRPGGSPARLGLVRAGEMYEAFNAADASGRIALGSTVPVVIGRTSYTDGGDTLRIDPVGLAPRTFTKVLRAQQPVWTFEGAAP